MDEGGRGPSRLLDHLNTLEALQYFLPQDAQLKFCQSVTHTAMNAESEGQVFADVRPVDDEKWLFAEPPEPPDSLKAPESLKALESPDSPKSLKS